MCILGKNKWKCSDEKSGELTLEECEKKCPEFELTLPAYVADSVSYSPFWYVIQRLTGVKIQIKYPFPSEYAEIFEKKGHVYEKFISFINDKTSVETAFRFIAGSTPLDWTHINSILFDDINFLDYYLEYVDKLEFDKITLNPGSENPIYINMLNFMKSRGIDSEHYLPSDVVPYAEFNDMFLAALTSKSVSVLRVHIATKSGGHANTLIINPHNKRYTYMEPHGEYYIRIQAFMSALKITFKKELKGWSTAFDRVKLQGQYGFCASWTSLFTAISVKNPSIEGSMFMYDMLLHKNKKFKYSLLCVWVFYVWSTINTIELNESNLPEDEIIMNDRILNQPDEKKKEVIRQIFTDYTRYNFGRKTQRNAYMRQINKVSLKMRDIENEMRLPQYEPITGDKLFIDWVMEFDMNVALGQKNTI
jgi:hypothetical protein